MNIEIGKKYRGLINGCIFEVIGLLRLSAWDKERNRDTYFDIKILNPASKSSQILSKSRNSLEHLQIEEVKEN